MPGALDLIAAGVRAVLISAAACFVRAVTEPAGPARPPDGPAAAGNAGIGWDAVAGETAAQAWAH